jgi:hypothetical protein
MDMKSGKHPAQSCTKRLLAILFLTLTMVTACKRLPNPVISENGQSYIPIADTAFLIPEKTWLTGFGRNSTDGMVSSISMHATVPDVQPWSPAVNDVMYTGANPGRKVDIEIMDTRHTEFIQRFPRFPNSRWGGELVEVPSDLEAIGLRRFKDETSHNLRFYELVKAGEVIYFMRCDLVCYLSFPWRKTLEIKLRIDEGDKKYSVKVADKVKQILARFEQAGQNYQPASSK